MKQLITIFLFAFPAVAMADYVDVLSAKLKDGCSIATFQQIAADLNATWAQGGDYKAQLMIPVKSEDLHTLNWVGRAASAEAYGRSLDRWVKEANDPGTVTGKLNERMKPCFTWVGRAALWDCWRVLPVPRSQWHPGVLCSSPGWRRKTAVTSAPIAGGLRRPGVYTVSQNFTYWRDAASADSRKSLNLFEQETLAQPLLRLISARPSGSGRWSAKIRKRAVGGGVGV